MHTKACRIALTVFQSKGMANDEGGETIVERKCAAMKFRYTEDDGKRIQCSQLYYTLARNFRVYRLSENI